MAAQYKADTSRKHRADLVTGLVIFAIAAFFYNETFEIPVAPDEEDLSSRFFPQSICIILGALGALLVIQSIRGIQAPEDNTSFDMQDLLIRVLPLSLLSFLYVWLFKGFGYIPATLVLLYAGCFLFRVRGLQLVMLPPFATLLFYYLFFSLMGVFEPPAEIFDLLAFIRD